MTYEEEFIRKLVANEEISGLPQPTFKERTGEFLWKMSTRALETLPRKSHYLLQDSDLQSIMKEFSMQQHQLLGEVKEVYVQLLLQFVKP